MRRRLMGEESEMKRIFEYVRSIELVVRYGVVNTTIPIDDHASYVLVPQEEGAEKIYFVNCIDGKVAYMSVVDGMAGGGIFETNYSVIDGEVTIALRAENVIKTLVVDIYQYKYL